MRHGEARHIGSELVEDDRSACRGAPATASSSALDAGANFCRTFNKARHLREDFDAAEKACCSIGGGSTAVVSIYSPLLITG
jgi:hypothetical protein